MKVAVTREVEGCRAWPYVPIRASARRLVGRLWVCKAMPQVVGLLDEVVVITFVRDAIICELGAWRLCWRLFCGISGWILKSGMDSSNGNAWMTGFCRLLDTAHCLLDLRR